MITADDLGLKDAALAARIIAHARAIAPCLDSLTDDRKKEAVAILQAIGRDAQASGARGVASRQVGTARVTYREVPSWFTEDDRAALRALCGIAAVTAGHPVGRFPAPPAAYRALWPEQEA